MAIDVLSLVDTALSNKVPLEEVRFIGTPHFMLNGSSWREPVDRSARWPDNLEFFGTPRKEIDDNWEELIGQRYFFISEEEAEQAWGEKRHQYVDPDTGGYIAG